MSSPVRRINLNNVSFPVKFTIAFSFITVMVLVVVGFGIYATNQVRNSSHTVTAQVMPAIDDLATMRALIQETRSDMDGAALAPDAAAEQDFRQNTQDDIGAL